MLRILIRMPITTYALSDTDIIIDPIADSYILRIKDLPDNEKPREKLEKLGPKHLTVPELIAVLWGVGTKKEELLEMSQRVIKEYGDRAIFNETNPQKLAQIASIPVVKASQLIASFEFGRRYFATQAGKAVYIRHPRHAYQYLKEMGSSNKEQLRGLFLNSRYQVIYDEVISVGTLTSSIIHPREIFRPAIEQGAIAIIVAHNHPSGSMEPTTADVQVTEQLISAGNLLGIELLDHLIITQEKYVSILDCLP